MSLSMACSLGVTAAITVTDEKGTVIYADKYAWKLPMNLADAWMVSTPETAAQISFYPSTNILGFRLQIYGNTDEVKVQVLKKGGKEIASRKFPVSKGEVIRYFPFHLWIFFYFAFHIRK